MAPENVQVYDFRRTDRIARDQIRAINMLHESFARSISASLSAYLRAYVVVNLVSVEQISFTAVPGTRRGRLCMLLYFSGRGMCCLLPSGFSALPWHGRGRRFEPVQVHHLCLESLQDERH